MIKKIAGILILSSVFAFLSAVRFVNTDSWLSAAVSVVGGTIITTAVYVAIGWIFDNHDG